MFACFVLQINPLENCDKVVSGEVNLGPVFIVVLLVILCDFAQKYQNLYP